MAEKGIKSEFSATAEESPRDIFLVEELNELARKYKAKFFIQCTGGLSLQLAGDRNFYTLRHGYDRGKLLELSKKGFDSLKTAFEQVKIPQGVLF